MDQVGAFLGGLDDFFEGRNNALTFPGRQAIAQKFRPDLIRIGNAMLRRKPADLRMILDDPIVARIDGEELAKFFRFAIETAKMDMHLAKHGNKIISMNTYRTALALEQDASSSGAQIIALTTKNKQVAELSNVIPTMEKKRLYDIVARDTFNDPRFREMNLRLGLTEKDLRKASKAKAMVSFYGAGERTGIMNIEAKLAKALSKQEGTLVIKAADRDAVLNEISARMARYQRLDPETYDELKKLRNKVRDVFNAGLHVGDDLMEALWFLDPKTQDLVSRISGAYAKRVTPNDFKMIGKIMSEHMLEQVPILGDFTRFFGRLAEDYLKSAKPKKASIDWKTFLVQSVRGSSSRGYVLPDRLSRLLGVKSGEAVSEKFLKRFSFWNPGDNLAQMLKGIPDPKTRQLGRKIYSLDFVKLAPKIKRGRLQLLEEDSLTIKVMKPLRLPKQWTTVPGVNFDGKILQQNYSMKYETRVTKKMPEGNTITNIVHQKELSEGDWWDELINKSGKIEDVADLASARTAYGVNLNHSCQGCD
jgi:hypothetical protein